MNFKILTLKEKHEWKKYLESLPEDQQDIYYTPEYYSLYENYGDGKAMCFVFEKDGDIALYPFLINNINELGYELDDEYFDIQGAYGYNGVVSSSYSKVFILDFYKSFNNYCRQNNIIAEFSRFNPLLKNEEFSKYHYNILYNRETVTIDLSDITSIENIWSKSYTKQARKDCKKAYKQGLTYLIANKSDYYVKFYLLYLETMKYIGATRYYYFNKELFLNIFSDLKKYHSLILIKTDTKLVGGFILFHYGMYAHNFLSAGSIMHRNLNINDYMQDIAINMSYKLKINSLNLGGGNSNNPNDTLFKFKSKFSNQRSKFFIAKKIHNDVIYTDIIKQWRKKFPGSYMKHNDKLLGYREIKNEH